MGRVIRREVIALRCELRTCDRLKQLPPLSLLADWHLQQVQLSEAVEQGWVLVLTPQLRSYCPEHAERALTCSCRTNPDRRHLCIVHHDDAARMLWSRHIRTPEHLGVFWIDEGVAA